MRVITFKLSDQEVEKFDSAAVELDLRNRSKLLHLIIDKIEIVKRTLKQENDATLNLPSRSRIR